jgi:hypothetical protein
MMLDSPHTSAPMLMRGNTLVVKTPVENAPRTSVEKHLSGGSGAAKTGTAKTETAGAKKGGAKRG